MQYFPSSLDRWLKSQANLFTGSTDPSEQWSFESWALKRYRGPDCNTLRLNWPPETLVATDSAPQGNGVWLILPIPTNLHESFEPKQLAPQEPDRICKLSLSKESRGILRRILNAQSAPELEYFSQGIPVCIIRRVDPHAAPWIAWQLSDSEHHTQSPPWELLASLLDRLGVPPKFICDDWTRQLQLWKLADSQFELEKQLPMIAHRLLVSKSGLLIPLSGLEFSSIDQPTVAPNPKRIVQASTKPKPSTLMTCIGLVLLASIFGWTMVAEVKKEQTTAPKLAVNPTPLETSPPASIDELSIVTEAQEELELTRTDDALSQDPVASLDTENGSMESWVVNSLQMNVRLASTQDPEPKLQQQQTEELPTPKADHGEQPAQDETVLVISQAIQKREFRVERGFSPKKAKGIFTLCLDQGMEGKLHVVGAMTQELLGETTGSWRIGMDELEAELVLSVQSKPGSKWQVNSLVQIPSETGGPLVPIGPKDPAAVLGRLAQYNGWLQQTADQWKFSASGTSKPGQPSPIQLARMYSAKQKDTERAIKRWRQIEQLSLLVFDSVRVRVDLQPQPPATAE